MAVKNNLLAKPKTIARTVATKINKLLDADMEPVERRKEIQRTLERLLKKRSNPHSEISLRKPELRLTDGDPTDCTRPLLAVL